MMTALQNFFAKLYGVKNYRNIVISAVVAIAAVLAFYQFFGVGDQVFNAMKGSIASIFQRVATNEETVPSEELSTGEVSVNREIFGDASWTIRKSDRGDSIWNVYRQMVQNKSNVSSQNQLVNGLKNITILKNNIAADRLASNSLTEGVDYSFLSERAVDNYAKKLAEAQRQINDGSQLKDLSGDLQLAYQIANAPSYQFLNSLQSDSLNVLIE